MSIITDEIIDFLSGQSIGTIGTDLFGGTMPDTPDSCVTVYATPGLESVKTMQNSTLLEQPRLEIISRASAYSSAWNRAYSAFLALDSMAGQELSGVEWLSVDALTPPSVLTRDGQNRILVSCTFQAIKKSS